MSKTWTYALQMTIPLVNAGDLKLSRDAIKSESDLIFMAGVLELKCAAPFTLECSAIREAEGGGFDTKQGTCNGQEVTWTTFAATRRGKKS
jgi:hypothetical protein